MIFKQTFSTDNRLWIYFALLMFADCFHVWFQYLVLQCCEIHNTGTKLPPLFIHFMMDLRYNIENVLSSIKRLTF